MSEKRSDIRLYGKRVDLTMIIKLTSFAALFQLYLELRIEQNNSEEVRT